MPSRRNHHRLAREFVLFDNFYTAGDASADGQNWSVAGIANDYVQKLWPSYYGRRRRIYDFEGGEATAVPTAGYLWDECNGGRDLRAELRFLGPVKREPLEDQRPGSGNTHQLGFRAIRPGLFRSKAGSTSSYASLSSSKRPRSFPSS